MKSSQEILSSLLKTAQMGQTGIRCVRKLSLPEEMHRALADQLREYDAIEQQAQALAAQRGWTLDGLAPIAKTMSAAVTRTQLMGGNQRSKIATMMIQGNTRGMIKGLKNLHALSQPDASVSRLSGELLRCEEQNIRQMQSFL